ncbi:GAF domain-containing sensor histidine kinase [Litchfieldia alkalitelluris]|uniref:GAF domain-containing sensor histidine kinase n=1 Tax=Litchfieldia alkalitelluris TaxID=304268 RepID=UPI0009965278|nr:sensor histidine kinase [Litchfieldia alkalitelluris]
MIEYSEKVGVKMSFLQKREKNSRLFMGLISICGWAIVLHFLLELRVPKDPLVLIVLALFLCVSEYFPMPVWKRVTTITFPLVYVIFINYGMAYTLFVYSIAVLSSNILYRRPLRTVLFNPAQLVISFYIAGLLSQLINPYIGEYGLNGYISGILQYATMLAVYYLMSNLIVDLVLLIRPQVYTYKLWKEKIITESNSAAVSLIYGLLLYILGSQNRGEIDVFSYFFFFFPLIGLSLLSSTITKLKREKQRLNALFSITSELNKKLPTKDWLSPLTSRFNEFIQVDACILWIKEDGIWKKSFCMGHVEYESELQIDKVHNFDDFKRYLVFPDRKKSGGVADHFFKVEIKSLLYCPLVVENETVGMFVIGRSRTKSIEEEDIRSIATLANQLAVVIKTRLLFSEQERRILLEERNRIARDIHDGVAQTLAGAIMKLDTAEKRFQKNPDETMKLVNESLHKLRLSLKEVRESIYALRPYPTERVGLVSAIEKRLEVVKKEFNQCISFEIRGSEIQLSSMVERVLFDTFQESLQNSLKHANANKIEVLLSYQSEHILLKIKDDGIGFSLYEAMIKARNQPHFGILQMSDRADTINASLQIDSKGNCGTEITITVPKMGLEGGKLLDQAHVSG